MSPIYPWPGIEPESASSKKPRYVWLHTSLPVRALCCHCTILGGFGGKGRGGEEEKKRRGRQSQYMLELWNYQLNFGGDLYFEMSARGMRDGWESEVQYWYCGRDRRPDRAIASILLKQVDKLPLMESQNDIWIWSAKVKRPTRIDYNFVRCEKDVVA